ncbi:uncharacterized protein NECHADRAFT_77401 [Fusarium vanettenii 77-13-4]|uniref:Uncharacterized protein n=1 Tax=Fusarium vanettenii (strain ATCC MYA-4622 / CBS 123669 / FGSC 9596 / NRRL 45880 / 77-13-4) TaxID=660122 RepID=C7YL45_FUSV7|nr:uncharacterized protein NECHADRAFT_77401 [Fusarium vanettenii 77-13-4]EEU47192.1 hypothetical protein NECHADRAFT_77401 [Fusarium vanettenii 77-13-4]
MLLFNPLHSRMVPGGSSVDLPEDSKKFNSHSPDPQTITKIVITAWVVGWFVFGIISILVINGNGRAGRWVPEWYLDSRGKMKHKLAVLGWWVFVVLFWPLIWIGYTVKKIVGVFASCVGKCKRRGDGLKKLNSNASADEKGKGYDTAV